MSAINDSVGGVPSKYAEQLLKLFQMQVYGFIIAIVDYEIIFALEVKKLYDKMMRSNS